MTKYKSWRIINGKPPIWVIVDEIGNILDRDPSKEELKGLEKEIIPHGNTKKDKYNENNICDICKEQLKIGQKGKIYIERDGSGNKTGRILCNNCWYNTEYKYRENTQSKILKSVGNRRTGNQNPNHTNTIGDLFQKLTCDWRSTVSSILVEDLNIKLDNYNSLLDHSTDSELGIIQTKGAKYNVIHEWWGFYFESECNKTFNYEICYCSSEDGKKIERVYIIPKLEIVCITGIQIRKNPTIGRYNSPYVPWYDKYRVKDKDILKIINRFWQKIIENNYHD